MLCHFLPVSVVSDEKFASIWIAFLLQISCHFCLPAIKILFFVFSFQIFNYEVCWSGFLGSILYEDFLRFLNFFQIWKRFTHYIYNIYFSACLLFPLFLELQWLECYIFFTVPLVPVHFFFSVYFFLLYRLSNFYYFIFQFTNFFLCSLCSAAMSIQWGF